MRITAHGWGRNMGDTVLADIDLSEKPLNKDERRTLHWTASELFWSRWGPEVHWTQNIRMTGDYRVKVQFSNADVIRLLRASYGTVLGTDLIERHGFTISPELEKAILRKVKLTDLTLGDLIEMNAAEAEGSATAEKLASADNVTRLKRRV
jgi:hypothetical protein